MANLKMPESVKQNKEVAAIFRVIQSYLKEFGEVEKADSNPVAILAFAMHEVETFSLLLAAEGYTIKDKNGSVRRRPEVMLRNAAIDTVMKYSKLLGVDRGFREKARGAAKSKGRQPVDKIGRLRKVGRVG